MVAESILSMIGLSADDPIIRDYLIKYVRGIAPELDPDDEENYVDWITINELGIEMGFEDEAFLKAWDYEKRRKGSIILSQVYFYSNTEKTLSFPFALPFNLKFLDTRKEVRKKLFEYEATRRSYIRDNWETPNFNITATYNKDTGNLESIFFHLPYTPWPSIESGLKTEYLLSPDQFVQMFGSRWHDHQFRDQLTFFDFTNKLADVKTEHAADYRFTYGFEMFFIEGNKIVADQHYPNTLIFAAVTFYAARELDSREWNGALPFGIKFGDTQLNLQAKIGIQPAEQFDDNLSGYAVWHFDKFSLNVLYSNIENRLLRITLMAPGYWSQ